MNLLDPTQSLLVPKKFVPNNKFLLGNQKRKRVSNRMVNQS